jgi:hypothetical protein
MIEGTIVKVTTEEETKKHSPRKALLLSTVLPGAGQVYNGKYWKVPIIYAGIGISLYAANWNFEQYTIYSDAFDIRIDGDETTIDEFDGVYSDEQLIQIQNFYRKNQEVSIIIAFAFYGLNILDANVDAHLHSFDISDDLSLDIEPTQYRFNNEQFQYSVIRFKLNF